MSTSPDSATLEELQGLVGRMDIYLLDQVVRGRVPAGSRILDAGCGRGRNVEFFLRAGYSVAALDPDPAACLAVQTVAARIGAELDIRQESLVDTTFPASTFDFVVSNAVLHFARDRDDFEAQVATLARLARPGGVIFARIATTFGVERAIHPVADRPGWYRLPDGSERFLVDLETLEAQTARHGHLIDPIKVVHVRGQRSMSTWVWQTRG